MLQTHKATEQDLSDLYFESPFVLLPPLESSSAIDIDLARSLVGSEKNVVFSLDIPSSNASSIEEVIDWERASLLSITRQLGVPLPIPSVGPLLQYEISEDETSRHYWGAPVSMHTDAVIHDIDWVLLYVSHTSLASEGGENLFSMFDQELLERRYPAGKKNAYTFHLGESEPVTLPIFDQSGIRFSQRYLSPKDRCGINRFEHDLNRVLIDEISTFAWMNAYRKKFEPGQGVIFNNKLHGRERFLVRPERVVKFWALGNWA